MAEAGILARSEIKVMIKNSYLDDTTNPDIDVVMLKPKEAFTGLSKKKGVPAGGINGGFEPRGLQINGLVDGDGVDQDATHAFLRYRAKNDPTWCKHDVRFNCGVVHPTNVQFISCKGTTARGIIIHG